MNKANTETDNNLTKQWCEQYKTEIHRFLTRRLYRSSIEVDDVMQEAYLRLLRVKNPDTIDNPRAYLYKVVSNIIPELEMKNGQYVEISELIESESPITGIDRVESISSLEKVLRNMPNTQRKVLIALKYEGKTYKEISQELTLSIDTVKRYAFLATLYCRKQGWL